MLVIIFLVKKFIETIKNRNNIPLKFICVAFMHAICSIFDSNTDLVPGINSIICSE
jgi:hypothetical protein